MSDAAVDPWVRRLNAIAREMDGVCATTHPSAWREQLQDMPEKWKRLAREGPDKHKPKPRWPKGG